MLICKGEVPSEVSRQIVISIQAARRQSKLKAGTIHADFGDMILNPCKINIITELKYRKMSYLQCMIPLPSLIKYMEQSEQI